MALSRVALSKLKRRRRKRPPLFVAGPAQGAALFAQRSARRHVGSAPTGASAAPRARCAAPGAWCGAPRVGGQAIAAADSGSCAASRAPSAAGVLAQLASVGERLRCTGESCSKVVRGWTVEYKLRAIGGGGDVYYYAPGAAIAPDNRLRSLIALERALAAPVSPAKSSSLIAAQAGCRRKVQRLCRRLLLLCERERDVLFQPSTRNSSKFVVETCDASVVRYNPGFQRLLGRGSQEGWAPRTCTLTSSPHQWAWRGGKVPWSTG